MRHLYWVLGLIAALALAGTAWARDPDSLTQEDYEGVAALRDLGPEVARSLAAADAAYERGAWQEAAALYGALPNSDDLARFPLRRRCQALTELGQHAEAIAACRRLLDQVIPNAADLQAMVGALMMGSGRPSDTDLRQALTLSRRIEDLDPESAWSEAARCAIARRIGDRTTLESCSARLAELAPGHRLTRRAEQAAGHGPLLAKVLKIALLGGLVLGSLLTLAHGFLSRRRRAVAATATLALASLLIWPAAAQAQAFGIVEEPNTSGPNSSGPPTEEEARAETEDKALGDETKLLSEVTEKLKVAEDLITQKQDWPGALVIYNQVMPIVPSCGKCWRRLCEGYSYMGMPVEGAHACRQAIASPVGNAWDRAMLVHHLLTGPDRDKPATREEATRTAADAVRLAPKERWGYDAVCEIALDANDLSSLKSCSAKLDQLAPDDRKTLSLLFSVALAENRFDDADALIERGLKGGLDTPTAARMREMVGAKGPFWRRLRHSAPLGLLAAAIATALALGGRLLLGLRSRARSRAAAALAPRA